ncbi:MAG: Arc family DNA-binding protein [Chloroflexi bacterium]|nr:Arc family DNA-binding protein [Chloroflexota bacterium]
MDGKREVRYSLRLPPDVHERLVELARREGRSLNQQLVHILRQGLRRADRREPLSRAEQ